VRAPLVGRTYTAYLHCGNYITTFLHSVTITSIYRDGTYHTFHHGAEVGGTVVGAMEK